MAAAPGRGGSIIHVVAGALSNASGEVLLARRHRSSHQGGLWEFPGGKLEPGETPRQGLERELVEELGIRVLEAVPLVRVRHDYPERRVLLDVWRVLVWNGEPRGCEGQPLRWCHPTRMQPADFPPADLPVIEALAAGA